MATTCLDTVVRNISDQTLHFSFIGKHGRTLAAGEEHRQPGSLVNRLADRPRDFAALQKALDDGVLVIVSDPAHHVYDATLAQTRVLGSAGGAVVDKDPCWGTYSSSSV